MANRKSPRTSLVPAGTLTPEQKQEAAKLKAGGLRPQLKFVLAAILESFVVGAKGILANVIGTGSFESFKANKGTARPWTLAVKNVRIAHKGTTLSNADEAKVQAFVDAAAQTDNLVTFVSIKDIEQQLLSVMQERGEDLKVSVYFMHRPNDEEKVGVFLDRDRTTCRFEGFDVSLQEAIEDAAGDTLAEVEANQ